MESDYFFTASSNELVLSMHFFRQEKNERLALNFVLNFASAYQSIECETVGIWLTLSDAERFLASLNGKDSEISLINTYGCSILTIMKGSDHMLLSHDYFGDSDSCELGLFSLKISINKLFLDELTRGFDQLVSWFQQTRNVG